MTKNFDRELLADVAERLIHHLKNRTDVQSIDLMNLSGFCKTVFQNGMLVLQKRKIFQFHTREMIYGMPYSSGKQNFKLKLLLNKKKNSIKEKLNIVSLNFLIHLFYFKSSYFHGRCHHIVFNCKLVINENKFSYLLNTRKAFIDFIYNFFHFY